ncbi:MAG: hypothetical protein K1X67_15860 [Fimbriimonadaceae bacterium]|nr:hypothetical protein [Fimbriimonadaceae bacterium]
MKHDQPARPPERRTCAGGPSPVELTQILEGGDVAGTIRKGRLAVRRDPGNVALLEVLARAQWAACRYEDVLQTTHTLIRLLPSEPGYRLLQAMAYQAMGRFGLAVVTLRQCLSETRSQAIHLRAEQMISDLEEIQTEAVRRLRSIDLVFDRDFRADPERACRERGFELSWFVVPMPTDRPAAQTGYGLDRA